MAAREPQEEGADGLVRRVPPGRHRAAAGRHRTGRSRLLPVHRRPEAGRHRARRGHLGPHALSRRAAGRHRRPSRDRRTDDGRDHGPACTAVAHRDAVRGRRDAGPGRDQHRQGVQRGPALDRGRADQARWRLARGRRAVGQGRHGQADQVRRRRREADRPGELPSGAHGQPDPRHGRHRVARRGGAQGRRPAGGQGARRQAEGRQPLRPERLRRAARADEEGAGCRPCSTSCRRSSRRQRARRT